MRIALVGLGNAGFHLHLPALAGMPSVALVGGCDPEEQYRQRAAALYRMPVFADIDEMLARCHPEVVVIGTPPNLHADHCLRSLAAGAHLVCEKPFVSTLSEADAVLEAAVRAGRHVAINHEFREMPIFRALRDAVAGPRAADLVFLQMWQLMDMPPIGESGWRGQMVQRTLFEAGVHLVDLAMTLFGEKPVSVQASTFSDRGQATDAVVVVTLEFSQGRLAHITQSRLSKGEARYFEVRADTKSASLRASFGGRARVSAGLFHSSRPHARFEFGRSGVAWKEVGNRRTFLARNPKNPTMAATRSVFEATFEAFHTGGEPPTSGRRGRDILEVIAAGYTSAANGQRQRLESPGQ